MATNQKPRVESDTQLPAELTDRANSRLAHDVSVAAKLYGRDDRDWIRSAYNARVRIRDYCAQFRPDFSEDPLGTTCQSGSHGDPPSRGSDCASCIFSLVSLDRQQKLIYLGNEPTVEDRLVRKIFAAPPAAYTGDNRRKTER